jgi:putative toxin-antitoxin system antitoxin component (TIGR02293 family)
MKQKSKVTYQIKETDAEELTLRETAYAAPLGAPGQLVRSVEKGLSIDILERLQKKLELPMDRLAPRLGLSKATLHRRRLEGRLNADESDKVVRYERLFELACQVLETPDNARSWLNQSQYGLGGDVPLDYARTEVGARQVEDLLMRIEHSVYS